MLPTPLASSDITVFILSPSLSLLGEAPGIGSLPSLFLGPRTDVLQAPCLPGLPSSQVLCRHEPPASGEGPPPLCYLGDHPACHAILQVKRHVCRKGLLAEPAVGLCQMPRPCLDSDTTTRAPGNTPDRTAAAEQAREQTLELS